ncbi:MAG: GumC family protein [Candidatus Omnitrophota bacterium]
MLSSNEINSVDIIKALNQNRKVIFIATFITSASVILTSLLMQPVYRATTKILLKKEYFNSSFNFIPYQSEENFYTNQEQIIKSKPVIRQALKIMPRAKDISNRKKDKLKDLDKFIKDNILVILLKSTNIIEISIDDSDPLWATYLANAITKSYFDRHHENKLNLIDKTLTSIESEIATAENQLKNARSLLEKYTQQKQIAILPESEIVLDLKRFARFDTALIDVDSDINKVAAKLEKLKKDAQVKRSSELRYPFIIDNEVIQQLQAKIQSAQIKLSDLTTEFTDKHPDVINADNQIKKLEQNLDAELDKIITAQILSYETEKQLLESKRTVLAKANADYANRLNELLANQPEISHLLDDIRYNQKVYQDLLNNQLDLKIYRKKSNLLSDMEVIEPAEMPEEPIRPNLLLNLILGTFVGLCIGCSLALLMPAQRLK